MPRKRDKRHLKLFRVPFYKRTWFKRSVGISFLVALVSVLLVVVFLKKYYDMAQTYDMDDIDNVELASVIYGAGGDEIGTIFEDENRENVSLDDLPWHLVQALVAAEDSRFYKHKGVDYIGIIRAVWLNFRAGETTQGASTITQQLARNAYPVVKDSGGDYQRKLVEAFLAARIEEAYSKSQILEFYFNRVYFGPRAYGIRAASQRYYSKEPRDLTVDEAAQICGLIKSPNKLSPLRDKEAALKTRNNVLLRMEIEGMLTAEDASAYRSLPLRVNPSLSNTDYPYAYIEVRKQLEEMLTPEQLSTGGFRIYTTIDSKLQENTEKSLKEQMAKVEQRKGYPHQTYQAYQQASVEAKASGEVKREYLQGGALVIDNVTGGILAMVGGRDYADNKFNVALWARRAAGTGFLPFIYGAAFEKGVLPGSRVEDEQLDNKRLMVGSVVGIVGEWGQESEKIYYEGDIPVRRGLIQSKISASVRVAEKPGLASVVDFARRAGVSVAESAEKFNSTLVGQVETTLAEYCLAYSVFAHGGKRPRDLHLITRVVDREGNEIYRWYPDDEMEVVTDAVTAYQVHSCLRDSLSEGTAMKARSEYGLKDMDAGGKTSTAYGFTDNWFIGYNSRVTCGVWTGLNRPNPIYEGAFSNETVLPIWVDVMNASMESYPPSAILPPAEATRIEVCKVSGKRATDYCYENIGELDGQQSRLVRTTYFEYIRKGDDPGGFCDVHQRDPDLQTDSLQLTQDDSRPVTTSSRSILPKGPVLIGLDPYNSVKSLVIKEEKPGEEVTVRRAHAAQPAVAVGAVGVVEEEDVPFRLGLKPPKALDFSEE